MKHLQIVVLVISSQILKGVRVLQERNDRGGALLQGLQTSDDLDPPLDHILRDVFGVVEALVDVHRVVDHVRLVQELYLRFQNLLVRVHLPLLKKLQQRKHQMPVQIRSDSLRQIVRRHCRVQILFVGGSGVCCYCSAVDEEQTEDERWAFRFCF